jgi:hypothetical protein
MLFYRQTAGPLEPSPRGLRTGVDSAGVGWIYAVLLAASLAVLVAAEWQRLGSRVGGERLSRRTKRRKRSHLHLVENESEEFAKSVERDLERLPTIDERDRS